MKIIVDATNLREGGGLSHLKNIFNFIDNSIFIRIIGGTWIKEISKNENIDLNIVFNEKANFFEREYFKKIKINSLITKNDFVFAPGGTFYSKSIRYVTMSRNMLVFENIERRRFPLFSYERLRLTILEYIQYKSFKNSSGIIFISEYARSYILNKYPSLKSIKNTVIYHGISDRFRQEPKKQKSIIDNNVFKLLYISTINYYKHHDNLIKIVKAVREKGFLVELDLIGGVSSNLPKSINKLLSDNKDFIHYHGKIPYEEIDVFYKKSDIFIYSSTCENMPNIVVEAMTSGLPIMSSNYGPMPEILKDGAVYFDPLNIEEGIEVLIKLLKDEKYRAKLADKSYNLSKKFSWKVTSHKTFDFIKEVYNT